MTTLFSFSLRIILLLFVMGSWYFGAWLVALPLTFVYLTRYAGYELCAVGVLLDIQFFSGNFVPYYGLSAVILLLVFAVVKPMMRTKSEL